MTRRVPRTEIDKREYKRRETRSGMMGEAMRQATTREEKRGKEIAVKSATLRDHFWTRKAERKWGSRIFASPVELCRFRVFMLFSKNAACNCSMKSVHPTPCNDPEQTVAETCSKIAVLCWCCLFRLLLAKVLCSSPLSPT